MHQNVLTINICERDVRRVRQTLRAIRDAVETRIGNGLQNLVFETIAEPLDSRMIVILVRKPARCTESDNVWNGRRSRTASLLLTTTNNPCRQRNSITHVKRADALRRVELVS
jgi:hypothetical protein